jgi:hypothetical protein
LIFGFFEPFFFTFSFTARDSPCRVGISFSGVGGPENAPRKTAFKRSSFTSFFGAGMPSPIDDPNIFRVPPDISQSLGEVIVAFSRVEALLAEFLSFLLEANPGFMYVLNQDVASSTQIKWIRALCEARFTDQTTLENLKKLFTDIDGVRIERNTYVHGVWSPGSLPGTFCVQTVKFGRDEIIHQSVVTSPDLDDLCNEITRVADELHMVGKKLGFIR